MKITYTAALCSKNRTKTYVLESFPIYLVSDCEFLKANITMQKALEKICTVRNVQF